MPLTALSITKTIDRDRILNDVSIELSAGKVLGICGPAGSGKRELSRVLAGTDEEFSGRIMLDGTEAARSLRSTLFSPAASGNASWFRRLFANSPYNDGPDIEEIEKLRVSDKQVVVFDGVFKGLSPAEKAKRFQLVREIGQDRQTYTILVTADFRDVLEFCDDCVLLDRGAVVQSGTPEELYEHPASSSAAAITGRVNLIEARRTSSSKSDVPQFQTIIGSHPLSTAKAELSRLGPIDQNVTLCIRPESLSISFGASFPEDNLLKAVIVDWKFLGPSTLVRLDAGGLLLEALVMRLVGLKPGDECMIGMPPGRISVLLK